MKEPPLDPSEPLPAGPTSGPSGFAREGETFQHYQVLRREDGSLWELGRGAMGVTYKAFDTNLRCHVALKVISAEYIHSETAGQRFVREARVAARLRHPHIASVYHLGVDPQGFFYSMEFIDGETLESLVERVGPLPLETVLDIGLQVARALAAAARQGLIHRDIKPANLMVLHEDHDGGDKRFVKMIDFGLARSYSAEDSSPQLTATGFVGTPLYSSPEQLEEQDLDVRSDIYSLGVTLWILLTGRPPFLGKMTQVITQHLHAPPPWWQLTGCPEPVRALLERMLHKNRLQRYQDAVELRVAIEACLRQVACRDQSQGPPPCADANDSSRGAPLAGQTPPETKPAAVDNGGGGAVAVRRLLGTVTGALGVGAAAKAGISPVTGGRAAGSSGGRKFPRWRSPLVIAPAVILLVSLLIYWRTPASTASAERSPKPAKTRAGVNAAADAATAPTVPVVPVATATVSPSPAAPMVPAAPSTPSALPNPAAVALETPPPSRPVPAASATNIPPPPVNAAAVPAIPSTLDGLDGTPTVTATATPTVRPAIVVSATPAASPAADDEQHQDADDAKPDNPTRGQAGTTRSTHVHHTKKPAPTPTPNFFQKLFGIKPKPTPKSR